MIVIETCTATSRDACHFFNSLLPGVWVRRSHRVHVAIDTSDEVEFLVGPTPERLSKVNKTEMRFLGMNDPSKSFFGIRLGDICSGRDN